MGGVYLIHLQYNKLALASVSIEEERAEWFQDLEEQEVCCEIASTWNLSEASSMKSQQHSHLNKS